MGSLRKQPTFGKATTGFPAKWRLRKEHRNYILMTRHYPDLGSASDWLNQISHAARPIRSTTQIWVVTRHQYGISVLVSQMSFGGETSGSMAKCQLFLQSRWRAGKERVALLSFSLRALPLTFMFSCIRFTCSLKWKSWSQDTTIDTFLKQFLHGLMRDLCMWCSKQKIYSWNTSELCTTQKHA